MRKKYKTKIAILSGAGLSAESNLRTFRDCENGYWNEYKIDEVCSIDAWNNNKDKVNEFYNMRRKEVLDAKPNKAHIDFGLFENCIDNLYDYEITHVTQNVDDLLERAGCTKVIHLHGNILKARSSNPLLDWTGISSDPKVNDNKKYDVGYEGLDNTKLAEDGYVLRPDIVFFGETLKTYNNALDIIEEADILIVVGTSLNVRPASGLVHAVKSDCEIFCIDLQSEETFNATFDCIYIQDTAVNGVQKVLDMIKLKNIN